MACPDPSSARVGSGGATFNALITAQELVGKQADCDFERCLVLLIHSGGDSQRLPLQSVCGKAWSALPVFSDRLELQAPVDLLIGTLSNMFKAVKAGVVVASSDVLLLIPADFHVDWPQEGATGLAIPSPKALGPNHGVYHVAALPEASAASKHVPVERFFQKASVDELASAGAVSPADQVLLDTGVIYFSPSATSTLLDLAQTAPVLSCTYLGVDTATRPLRVELYSDMLLAMSGGLGQTFAQFRDMDTADLNPDRLAAARGLLWRDLSPMPLFAAVAQGGTFLHVGTTPEYRSLLTVPTAPTAALGLRRWAACFDRSAGDSMSSVSGAAGAGRTGDTVPPGGMGSLNTVFESAGGRGEGAFAEHCVLRGDWSLGAGAIASGVRTVEHLRLRPGFSVQESFVAEPADWAPLDVANADDDFDEDHTGDEDDGASRGSRECAEPHIVIRTRSASRPDEATAAFRGAPAAGLLEDSDAAASGIPGFVLSEVRCVSLCDVADYFKPTAKGALVKSALLCLGVLEIPGRAEGVLLKCDGGPATGGRDEGLEDQLRACFGEGGLEVETWSQLPQGSGLGVSSILAAAVLAAISRCAGVRFSNASLTHLVLTLEQLLSTGGGYQDQVGGLYGGVQASVCAPGLPVRVEAFSLDQGPGDATAASRGTELASFLDGHLFVMYTGISRLAKNLLQRVLRQWALRDNGVTSTVAALRLNAVAMTRALADRDAAQVGHCLETYWEQKKLMAPDAEPERVAKLREVIRPFVHGSSLCGAGGGGFLVAVKRPEVSLADLRKTLNADPRTDTLQWTVHTASIAATGLEVRV